MDTFLWSTLYRESFQGSMELSRVTWWWVLDSTNWGVNREWIISERIRFYLVYDMQTANPPPPHLKCGQHGFFFQKCAQTNEKTIFRFFIYLVFEIWSIFYSKYIESLPKCHHKWPNHWVLLRFCVWLNQNVFQKIVRKWK